MPVRTTVGFRDVNWAAEAEKSQQGFERRKKAKQRRVQRKDSRRIATKTNKQLRSFLLFSVSDDEKAAQLLSMDGCNCLLLRAVETEFVTFQDGGDTNINKVRLLLDMFDSVKNNPELRHLVLSWMYGAVRESLYSVPVDDSLTYSSTGLKSSSDTDNHASQIPAVDIDLEKVKEFGRVIALLKVDEIEKQRNAMNIPWETMPGTWETAQVHINEIMRKINTLELDSYNSQLRTQAMNRFKEKQTLRCESTFFAWLSVILPRGWFWPIALPMSPHVLPALSNMPEKWPGCIYQPHIVL